MTARVLLSLAVSAIAAALPPAAQSALPQKMYVFVQRNSALGEQVVYIASDYLRLEQKQLGVAVLIRPGAKKIAVVNPVKMVYCEVEPEKYRSKALTSFGYIDKCYRRGMQWRQGEEGAVSGVRAIEYTLKPADNAMAQTAKHGGERKRQDGIGKKSKEHGSKDKLPDKRQVTCWVATEVPIGKPAAAVLAKGLHMESIARMPLRLTFCDADGRHPRTYLDTNEAYKHPFNERLFTIPKSYKSVVSEYEVIFNLESNELKGIDSILYRDGGESLPDDSLPLPSTSWPETPRK